MNIVALAGGVGGSKLVHGFSKILTPEELTIVVNTGDDFEHFGLTICPDIDTVCYALVGIGNPNTGWGQVDDTFRALDQIEQLGGPNWFRIGDKDFGIHMERTRLLKSGKSLSQITKSFCQAWGIKHVILPMTDDPVRTFIRTTNQNDLGFQEYFVHQKCEPIVTGFSFRGSNEARPAPGVCTAIEKATAVVFCPSNPWVSIDPILSIPGISEVMNDKLVIAISPIIRGTVLKGPAAKMFSEMGIEPSSISVAEHYRRFLSGFILDNQDANNIPQIRKMGIETFATNTIMNSHEDRRLLAQDVLNLIERLIKKR